MTLLPEVLLKKWAEHWPQLDGTHIASGMFGHCAMSHDCIDIVSLELAWWCVLYTYQKVLEFKFCVFIKMAIKLINIMSCIR